MKAKYNPIALSIDIEMSNTELERTIYSAFPQMVVACYHYYHDGKDVPWWLAAFWAVQTAHYLVPGIQTAWDRCKWVLVRIISVSVLYLYYRTLTEKPLPYVLMFLIGWALCDFVRGFVKGFHRAKSS